MKRWPYMSEFLQIPYLLKRVPAYYLTSLFIPKVLCALPSIPKIVFILFSPGAQQTPIFHISSLLKSINTLPQGSVCYPTLPLPSCQHTIIFLLLPVWVLVLTFMRSMDRDEMKVFFWKVVMGVTTWLLKLWTSAEVLEALALLNQNQENHLFHYPCFICLVPLPVQ